MLGNSVINRTFLMILGISAQPEPGWIQHHERLITIGFLAGEINGTPEWQREAWIMGQVGKTFPGFPDGLTEEECKAIYAFATNIREHYQ